MEFLVLAIAMIAFVYLLFLSIEFVLGFNIIKNLADQTVPRTINLPTLSIILSVLNEESNVETVVNSLMDVNYPSLEIIIMNDRSTDETPAILQRLQKKYPTLQIHHVENLPAGWFGKNHALHIASQHARGEWLLFTDADVTMKSGALRKAMTYALNNNLDHLTIHELLYGQEFGLKVFLLGQYIAYSMMMKPWRIRYTWSKKSLGRGAFNLIKKEVYQKVGGHHAIAMECLDDLKLGKLVKQKGFKQDIVDGQDLVEFKWYGSLRDMVAGLEKNSFAYHDYKIKSVVINVSFALLFFIWPIIAVTFFSGWVKWINLCNIGLTFYVSAYVAKQFRIPKRYAVFYPLAILILLYTVINSAFSTHRNKGVIWRGTHYPLKLLKNQKLI